MTKPCSSSRENRNFQIRAHRELDHPTLVALRKVIPTEIQTTFRNPKTELQEPVPIDRSRRRRQTSSTSSALIARISAERLGRPDPLRRSSISKPSLSACGQVPTGKGRCATHFLEIRLRHDTNSKLNGCSNAACKSKKYNHRNSWTSNYCRGSGSHDEIFAPAN
jgi:hypothetical protein